MTDNQSAFGEHVMLPVVNEVVASAAYGVIDDRLEVFSATGGSTDVNDNLLRCQTGASIGGYGVIRTKQSIIYHPGEAIRGRITGMFTAGVANSLQFAGLFSLTETLAFGYDGADFGIIYERHGKAECQEIEVTGAAGGAESATVTLGGDAATANLTATTAAGNAFEIARDCNADATLGAKWNFFQNGDKVIAVAKSVGDKTGTMSFSSATATATVTEKQAGALKTKTLIKRADWNMNTDYVIDPTKLNIYQIDYGYLGSSSITFSVYDHAASHFIPVHRIENKDLTKTSIGNPSLKIGWTAASLGSSGTNLVTQGGSASIQKIAIEHQLESGSRAVDFSKTGIGQTLTNIITLRNRGHYGYRYNLGNVLPLAFSVNHETSGKKGLLVEIIKNATIAGVPNFTYSNENDSIVEYDTAGTTVTNGELISSFVIEANGSLYLDIADKIDGLLPRETLTVAALQIGTGATDSTDASISWKEDK